jgi:hypothetical protein
MADQKVYLKWAGFDNTWGNNPYQWYDVAIVIQVGGIITVDPSFDSYLYPDRELKKKLPPEKYEHFVKLVYKVNGLHQKEAQHRKRVHKPIITLKEIQRTIQEVAGPIVKVLNISREDI